MFKTALILALAAPAAAFVDGRAPAANKFFSDEARSPVPFPLRSRMQLLDGGVHRLTDRRLQGGS